MRRLRALMPAVIQRDAAIRLVKAAYRAILGRDPDPTGLESYVDALQSGRDPAWLIEALSESDERRRQRDPFAARFAASPMQSASESSLALDLRRCDALPRHRYDALWNEIFASEQSLIVGQQEYGVTHRERFFESMNAALVLLRGRKAPQMLEFGPSEFSAMYSRLVPDLSLVISDRPVSADYIGFTEARCRSKLHCAAYAAIDLADIHDMDEKLRALGTFDLVVLAEVIEHLPIHPVDLLARVLPLLKPDGALYLTTPNFFAAAHLDALARGENPCAVYPPGTDNWDAHHHFREYEAVELGQFIEQAGGRVDAFHFSACWDAPGPGLPAHRRGNMVFVVRRNQAASPP